MKTKGRFIIPHLYHEQVSQEGDKALVHLIRVVPLFEGVGNELETRFCVLLDDRI